MAEHMGSRKQDKGGENINILEEFDSFIDLLNQKVQGAQFCRSYGSEAAERSFSTPVAAVSAASEAYGGEEGEAEIKIVISLYVPPLFSRHAAERILEEALQAVCDVNPAVISISREAPSGADGAVLIRGAAVVCPGCVLKINGNPVSAAKIQIEKEAGEMEIKSIGCSSPSYVAGASGVYRGEITLLGLEEAEGDFTLEHNGYRYEGCRWTKIDYGTGARIKKAVFTARKRAGLNLKYKGNELQ